MLFRSASRARLAQGPGRRWPGQRHAMPRRAALQTLLRMLRGQSAHADAMRGLPAAHLAAGRALPHLLRRRRASRPRQRMQWCASLAAQVLHMRTDSLTRRWCCTAEAGQSCPDIAQRSAAVTAECCNEASEDCTSGVPTVCNEGCAALFLPVRTPICLSLSRLPRLLGADARVCAFCVFAVYGSVRYVAGPGACAVRSGRHRVPSRADTPRRRWRPLRWPGFVQKSAESL